MQPKISIGACRRAIEIAGGSLPLRIRGESVPITGYRHGLCRNTR